jgi:hypothetical protein
MASGVAHAGGDSARRSSSSPKIVVDSGARNIVVPAP